MAATVTLARKGHRLQTPTRPAIYARISADAEQRGLGVQRQVEDGRDLLAQRGWPAAIDVYVDNDISASRKQGRVAHRPEWSRLLDDVAAGRVDAVVAWELDRLYRDPFEQESFFIACERAGVLYVATFADEVDIARGEGMMIARIKAAVAAEEARKTRERVVRKKVEIAEAGRPAGGPRPFGFEPDQATLRESEAAMIREAASRILAGETPGSVCRSWNAEDRLTARGKEWMPSTLATILTSPRVAGLRQHQGAIVGDAGWPAIIDRASWERLAVALRRPDRQGLRGTSRLLSGGLLRCGRCGTAMHIASVGGKRRYRCPVGTGRGGCGGVTIVADDIDDLIVEAVMQRLDTPALARRLRDSAGDDADAQLGEQLANDERRLLELADDYADERIGRAEWLRLRDRVEARVKDARGRLAKRASIDVLAGADGGALRASWPELEVTRRRAIVSAVIDRITIAPARPGFPRFDPERIDVAWRG
jgi:site-specific DNA recombinase